MARILIGDAFVSPDDIVEISEKNITVKVAHKVKNPKPKPTGFFAKLAYSEYLTKYENIPCKCWVLKVKNGYQTVLPSNSDNSDFSIGRGSYGTHQIYTFYTVYNDPRFLTYCKEEKEKLKDYVSDDTRSEIISMLCSIGMDRHIAGWMIPDYLDTHTLLDKSITCKADIIEKYVNK